MATVKAKAKRCRNECGHGQELLGKKKGRVPFIEMVA